MPKQFQFDWFSHNIPSFERHLAPLRGTPCRLLEIGSHEGRSTTWLLENVASHTDASIDCIDIHVQDNFWPNIAASDGLQRVSFHRGTSQDALRVLPRNAFDFVFIDGHHWTAHVLEDAVMSFPLCKTGGLIAFDDYLWDEPGFNQRGCPKPAIDFFLGAYSHKLEVLEQGLQVWIRKRAD
jgi:predicted O-methyltransferase YrrM